MKKSMKVQEMKQEMGRSRWRDSVTSAGSMHEVRDWKGGRWGRFGRFGRG